MLSRRTLLQAGGLCLAPTLVRATGLPVAATWDSLSANYTTPQWFSDAKFGIWAHWGPQCVPEWGDWYGRQMYQQGNPFYEHHVKTYGHPSQFGFMEFNNLWKAEAWNPEQLIELYKAAGAKYFVSLANHHDNLDTFNSRYHHWNTMRVGPKQDIVGRWAKAARQAGLRFGVSNHSAHAWHWFQTAYGYDAEGPLAGVRYDAYRLTKADGKGKWWNGLDPQELYVGRSFVIPDGVDSIKAMNAWHDSHDGQWLETPPPNNPRFVKNWLLRCNDLIDQYHPDLVYFDDYGLPLGQAGLDATAHYYNANLAWNRGTIDAVVTAKKLNPLQRKGIVEDIERGFSDHLRTEPWQTDTCIGNWHYDRNLYNNNGYKTAKDVVQRLGDVVSKNGNLLLSIPMRGNGTIDEKELVVLQDLAGWMAVNEEAIFGTRPWRMFGEGPTKQVEGMQNEGAAKSFTAADLRFTTKNEALYVLGMDWPDNDLVITASKTGAVGPVQRVELLGATGAALEFVQSDAGLTVKLPRFRPSFTPVLKLWGLQPA